MASILAEGIHVLRQFVEDYNGLVTAIAACVVSHVLWSVYTFSILPTLRPNEPKELPYSVPILGHLFGFFGNSDTLLTHARKYMGDTREPFTLTVAGMRTYILTKADHANRVYKDAKSFSYEEFVQSMMRILGNSEASVKAMYTPLPKDKEGFPNPHGKPLGILFREMHVHQLNPGKNLDFLEERFYANFCQYLAPESMKRDLSYVSDKTSNSIVVPLTQWCSDFFVRAGQDAYFGPKLAEIDSGLTDSFLVFDELSYQVIYQYPNFLARKMQAARDRSLRGLATYLKLPKDQRTGDAWFVKAMEDEMRNIGMNDQDMAIAALTIYWAINTNTRKAAYWLISYLVQDPELMDVVRKETAPAFRADGTADFEYLHTSTPHLDAAWTEMLRLAAYSASVRFVADDVVLGGKTLRKGNRLIIPYRQLHMDESVFGGDALEFRHTRFVENPRLATSSNLRPYGGGATMCPGRHVAKRAVLLFVAMVLRDYDIELEGTAGLEPDMSKPAPGLMSPKIESEMKVRLTERKKN
jgi:hypothetical protein